MLATHKQAAIRYEETRRNARNIAEQSLPQYLKGKLKLKGVDRRALAAFSIWQESWNPPMIS